MSTDTSAGSIAVARDKAPLRHAALRIAFGVTGCFALAEALDWDFTFVGPMLAAQMLVKIRRAPTITQGLTHLVIIALATGLVLLLTTCFITAPAVLILALGLLLTLTYYAQFRGAPEIITLLLQIAAVTIPVFAVVSTATAAGFASTLLQASIVALVAAWATFAIFPAADNQATMHQTGVRASLEPSDAAPAALRNALILLPVLTWYVLDATQVAVVSLITIVTILRQYDPRQGGIVASLLLLGNVVGGLAATLVYNLVLLGNTLTFFVLVCLAASLLFAGRIVMGSRYTPILAVAFATFILLLGLGLSPVPGGSGEAFIGRLVNMFLAAVYTVGALSILHTAIPRAHAQSPVTKSHIGQGMP
jgi:hypothetical protein